MSHRNESRSHSVATAAVESKHRRRTLLVCWFTFVLLGMGAIVAARVSGQAPGAAPPAAQAPVPARQVPQPAAANAGAPAPAAPAGNAPAAAAPAPAARAAAAPAAGGYESLPLDPRLADPKVLKKMETAAKGLVTARDLATYTDLNVAQAYFLNYLPAKITQPDATAEISTLVNDALQLFNRAQRSGNPGSLKMLQWLYVGMKQVAEGNFPPAARINATLVLGKLDQKPADNATEAPPVPLRYSYPVLVGLYKNPNNPDGVRAAALHGLHRYVSYGFPTITPEDRAPLAAEMKKLLSDPTPAGRSPKAHAYMQRFAVDILDLLRAANDDSLTTQLVSLSTSQDQPNLIALYSAARLGKIGKLQGKVATPTTVLESWSQRALQSFEAELARLKALDRPKPALDQPADPASQVKTASTPASSGYGEMGMGMDPGMQSEYSSDPSMMMGSEYSEMDMGMGMGMGYGMGMMAPPVKDQPPEVLASRRQLNHVLEQLQLGVTGATVVGAPAEPGGLLSAAGEVDKPAIDTWIITIQDVVTALNDSTLDDRTKYVAGLEAQILVLQELAGKEDAANQPAQEEPAPLLPGETASVPAAAGAAG